MMADILHFRNSINGTYVGTYVVVQALGFEDAGWMITPSSQVLLRPVPGRFMAPQPDSRAAGLTTNIAFESLGWLCRQ